MLHHDAITGTQTVITEHSYYDSLEHMYGLLEELETQIETTFSQEQETLESKFAKDLENVKNLPETIVTRITTVNPTGFERQEILNITVPAG